MPKMKCVCEICGKEIYRKHSQIYNHIYCSRKCYGMSCRKIHLCPICNKEILGHKNSKHCSKTCANKARTGIKYHTGALNSKYTKYKKLKKQLILERGGVCQICMLDKDYLLDVHHIVPKKRGGGDNLDNLMLLCPNCHREKHYRMSHEV